MIDGAPPFVLGMITAFSSLYLYRTFGKRSITHARVPAVKGKKYMAEEPKMIILLRQDLNMGKGKAAAQACHAVLSTYKYANQNDPSLVAAWENSGQAKVTLRVSSEEELLELVRKGRECGIAAQYIRDAGRTQLASGTATAAALGPAPKSLLDLVTGHLKLY